MFKIAITNKYKTLAKSIVLVAFSFLFLTLPFTHIFASSISATTIIGGIEDVPGINPTENTGDFNDQIFKLSGDLTLNGAGTLNNFTSGIPNESGSIFWDQHSLDGIQKNIGYCMTGTGTCSIIGTPYTGIQYYSNGVNSVGDVTFTANGSVTVTLLGELSGYAGIHTLGWYDPFSPLLVLYQIFSGPAIAGATFTFTPTGTFALYSQNGVGQFYSSVSTSNTNTGETSQQRFAFFAVGNVVPPPPVAPTVTLNASLTSIPSGGSSILTWTSTNANSCAASNGWTGSKSLSGNEAQTNLTSTKTYVITCTGPGGSVFSTVTITVAANNPPVITLVGATPVTITVGGTYTDAGATAVDIEDGNITANIVKTGSVNTSVVGTYTLTYNVSDSQGLAATPVTRTVNVVAQCVPPQITSTLTATAVKGQEFNYSITSTPASGVTVIVAISTLPTGLSFIPSTNSISGIPTQTGTFNISISASNFCSVDNKILVLTVNNPPNTPPVITLIGANPFNTIIGSAFIDPLATSTDLEDGNLTSSIVVTGGPVNINALGTTTLTYTVTDSGGLMASTTRVVVVKPIPNGTITICKAFVNQNNTFATTSAGLAVGNFGLVFATTTDFAHTSIFDGQFSAVSFSPNFTLASTNQNTAECITHTVPYGTYYYSQEQISGNFAVWTQYPVRYFDSSNIATFSIASSSAYATGNPLSDGIMSLSATTPNISLVVLNTYQQNVPNVNQPPVITLIGLNPINLTIGGSFTDPMATSTDLEDGNLTSSIVVTGGPVNINALGTTTLTYTVTDSGGLSASTTRQVSVVPAVPPPATSGTITFCLLLTDQNNVLATNTASVPAFGIFNINLASTTNIINSTISSKTWTSSAFSPNKKTILNVNDSDCYTVSNLNFGTYYYSQLGVIGSFWESTKYNDQFSSTVNNIFDFSNYSGELFTATTADDAGRNFNSDGQVILNSLHTAEIVYVLSHDSTPPLMCVLPTFTSSLAVSATVGTAFSYQSVATSTTLGVISYSIGTSTLPVGLSFSTATGIISGTPTTAGTFTVKLIATNGCGQDFKNLVITVNPGTPPPPPVCTSNCGGGGGNVPVPPPGGGGNGPIVPTHLKISNEKVVETVPGVAFVTWDTNMLATRRTVYGNATSTSTITPNYGYSDSTQNISSPLLISHGMVVAITQGQTYYFRPVSTATTTNNPAFEIAVGKELVLTPAVPAPNVCYYLNDYLRKDFTNNPVEVKKLQAFLNGFEGSILTVNGVYDDATIAATNIFQVKYGSEVLTPWGHDGSYGTGYVYILTKKKVNEIYCKRAFPVTPLQQNEIDSYRDFVLNLQKAGVTVSTSTSVVNGTSTSIFATTPPVLDNDVVGFTTTSVSSTTPNVAVQPSALARVSKNAGNLALAFVSWPFHLFSRNPDQCPLTSSFSFWLNWILAIVIGAGAYLWYRQYKGHKTIEDINREIDLQK